MRRIVFALALALPFVAITADSGGGKASGVPTAPVKIEVFSDFQCSHCKTLYEQTLRPLTAEYVRSGKVYLVHREFPRTGGPYSVPAAQYATAAARIGKYTQVADALFAKQTVWGASGKVEEVALSVLSAPEAAKVRALVKDPSVAAENEKDVQLAQGIPIRQTPTMIITKGQRQFPLTGSMNYSLLRRFIDELLAK
jgi:protein-disulfide isomerase